MSVIMQSPDDWFSVFSKVLQSGWVMGKTDFLPAIG